jgi:L-lactate dehydrogenase complex protein LldF
MDQQNLERGFVERYQRALHDQQLQQALSNVVAKTRVARSLAMASASDDWEHLRQRAREIKEHTIDNLDYYLEQFSANVERQGGKICWANNAAEANLYITNLARERGARLAVKGKSMMSEEIELNHALKSAGIEALETDLGEFIVQLAGERPSHINMPAIHKTRSDIADLFTEKLKIKRTEDIPQLAGQARRLLRKRFAEAQIGITGINFAVAETGTIVLVENEGNIRMTTSLPRLHIAIMGIEKLIPTLADLNIFMQLLSLSASGQKMCSYVSLLTGVKRLAKEEGPEEFHIVILDNGRSEMLADQHLRESLYCIRCGACLNSCPVYQKIGGHAYGWVYPGPIGAVLTPQLIGREKAADLPFASSLCGACHEVCPVKINIPKMLLHLRSQIKEGVANADIPDRPAHNRGISNAELSGIARLRQGMRNAAEHGAFRVWAMTMKSDRAYERAARLLRLAQTLFGYTKRKAPRGLPVPGWSRTRDFPLFAQRSFREQWAEMSPTISRPFQSDTTAQTSMESTLQKSSHDDLDGAAN